MFAGGENKDVNWKLEARAGIGRFMPCFRTKNTCFSTKQVTRHFKCIAVLTPLLKVLLKLSLKLFEFIQASFFDCPFQAASASREIAAISLGGSYVAICQVSVPHGC